MNHDESLDIFTNKKKKLHKKLPNTYYCIITFIFFPCSLNNSKEDDFMNH